MHVSIWQQFSSNHSASFSIVGTFASAAEAEQAAAMVRNILRRIAAFWQGLASPEAEAWWKRISEGEITPVEQEISRELGIEWSKDIMRDRQPHDIDWLPSDPDEAEEAVSLLDHHVFITNIGDTYVGAEPFETILR